VGPCPLGLLSPLNHQFLVVQPVLSMEIKFPISYQLSVKFPISISRWKSNFLSVAAGDIVRDKELRALDLPEAQSEEELLNQLAAHPEAIQRPIVVVGDKARIGRPPEQIIEIL